MSQNTIEILLVEDNAGDVELTREAFLEGRIANTLHVARDGIEALEMLKAKKLRPDIVLLDLNLPRKSGLEVLGEIKDDPVLCTIPVVILTTSRDEMDIAKSYRAHANCYITKPVDFDKFIHIVRSLEDFWLTVVRLPNKELLSNPAIATYA
jgi:two-component system, chemotaxis family, response regulator Rcp1